jgi:hypothetical protein
VAVFVATPYSDLIFEQVDVRIPDKNGIQTRYSVKRGAI